MAVDLRVLKAKLAEPAYSGLGDADASELLNTPNRTSAQSGKYNPIPSSELLAWAGANDRFKRIKLDAENVASPTYSVSNVALRMVERDGTNLDLSLPDRMTMLRALEGAGVLTTVDTDALKALGNKTISVSEELFDADVTPSDVANARRLP